MTTLSRRRILHGLAGATSAAGLSGCTRLLTRNAGSVDLDLPPNPRADRLPARQHALNEFLRRDEDGNPVAPRYHAVLLLELRKPPTVEHARTVERAMRTVEAAYDWSPDGLFHLLAWGSRYFARRGDLERSPVHHPEVLSRTDEPELQAFDAALVLRSDDPGHLLAAEKAMFHGHATLNGVDVTHRLGDVFRRIGRRTGFTGNGLPAEHADVDGIPDDAPIPPEAPLFMGFRSGRRGTQASEDAVTVPSGPFAGGTTMHLSRIRQSLSRWYDGLSERERVHRMFSPSFDPEDVEGFDEDVPVHDAVRKHAREAGVVGHQEKVARERRDGKPRILRRDFNTVDGGHAGLHFISLQRSLSDFEATRKAMNGWYLRDDSAEITDRRNNGILAFMTVVARANFYVPPREGRSFPLL